MCGQVWEIKSLRGPGHKVRLPLTTKASSHPRPSIHGVSLLMAWLGQSTRAERTILRFMGPFLNIRKWLTEGWGWGRRVERDRPMMPWLGLHQMHRSERRAARWSEISWITKICGREYKEKALSSEQKLWWPSCEVEREFLKFRNLVGRL